MNRPFRYVISLGLAVLALSWASGAVAQSTADGKRTLKAEKIFYKEPGMIEVTLRAMRGTLMMTGYVATDENLKKADELAEKVKGIKDIRNRIRVRDPEVASAGDDTITAKIDKAIEEDEDLARAKAKGKLEIEVSEGNVVAKGKLPGWDIAQTLVNDIKKIGGVKTLNLDDLKY
jgi:osmotically-inducible protein OsmY